MHTLSISDSRLVQLYIKGSEQALEALIVKHRRKLLLYLNSYVNDTKLAEDLFQDVFVKIITQLKTGRYKEHDKFEAWMCRIARNAAMDAIRHRNRIPKERGNEQYNPVQVLPSQGRNSEERINQEHNAAVLRKLIMQLHPDLREVIIMRHYSQMSFKEIADVTNVSINTALGRMRYALINLRKMIEERNLGLVA